MRAQIRLFFETSHPTPIKEMIRSEEVKDPDFEKEIAEGRCRPVMDKCKNGKVRGRSSAPIYVVIRIDLDGADTDADVLGYSYSEDCGCPFIETVAARDAFGAFWNFQKNGSPCFDPIADDGSTRQPPTGRFIMWDELEESADPDNLPDTTKASLTIYEAGDDHKPIRRYKLVMAQPTINDYVQMETAGDLLFK
jgi:hypothetical protein